MSLPPREIPLGAIRFNSDSQKLEYWIGDVWMQVKTFSPDFDGGARAVFHSGRLTSGTDKNNIDYITISTAGNAIDFGDSTQSTGDAVDFGDLFEGRNQVGATSDSHGGLS